MFLIVFFFKCFYFLLSFQRVLYYLDLGLNVKKELIHTQPSQVLQQQTSAVPSIARTFPFCHFQLCFNTTCQGDGEIINDTRALTDMCSPIKMHGRKKLVSFTQILLLVKFNHSLFMSMLLNAKVSGKLSCLRTVNKNNIRHH